MCGAVVGYHHWPRTLAQGRDGIKGIHQFGHFIAIFTCDTRPLHSDKAGNAHCRWRGEGGSFVGQVITICSPATTHPSSPSPLPKAHLVWDSESGWIGLEAEQQGAPGRSAVWQWEWWKCWEWTWLTGTGTVGRCFEWWEWLGWRWWRYWWWAAQASWSLASQGSSERTLVGLQLLA